MPYRSTIIVPLFLILLMLLLVTAACSLPEFSTESSSAANAVPADNQEGTEQTVASGNDASTASENADKQAGVAAAADAVAEEVVAEVAPAEVVESTESEAAPVDINWLATTNQVEYELRAIGNPDAALTITEFSDFMWPGCRAHVLGVENELKAAYVQSGQVRFIFNPVLNHGDRSIQSHMASECAGDQGQFWPFRTYLFENQGSLWSGDIRQTVKDLAANFGLEMGDFNACIDEQRHLARLTAQDDVRKEKGIQGQPMFDVGGEVYGGSAPFDAWAKVIDTIVGN